MDVFDRSQLLEEMYDDVYFPIRLVDKVKKALEKVVDGLEVSENSLTDLEIEELFNTMTNKINILVHDFWAEDSEIETIARESIGIAVDKIIFYFHLNIDRETAISKRDW